MNLQTYFEKAPKDKRKRMLESLARAHQRPVSTVYKWKQRKNHPVDEATMSITERWSDYQVTRFDERPDIFCLEGVISLLQAKGMKVEKETELES